MIWTYLGLVEVAEAAADAGVVSLASDIATTTKDTVMGVLTANAPSMILVGVAIFSIFLVWRLLKRFTGGR